MERPNKRHDYLEWDEYFMGVAFLAAQRSKDPSTQVGACIVNDKKKIVGVGYNGFPIGCSDDELPWSKTAPDRLDTKYPYVCHAELNAIINKNSSDVHGCVMYVTLFPCNECAKLAIQAGIRGIIYLSDKHHEKPEMAASRKLFDMVGVTYDRFVPKRKSIVVDFESGARADMERSVLLGPIEYVGTDGDAAPSETTSERINDFSDAREAYVLNARILAHAVGSNGSRPEDLFLAMDEEETVVARSISFLKTEGLLAENGDGRLCVRIEPRSSTPVKRD